MPHFDLPEHLLREYRPQLEVPGDLDDFWDRTLAEARSAADEPAFVKVDNGLTLVRTYDVSYSGFAGDRVGAWLFVPNEPVPGAAPVVELLGYSLGRGLPHEVPTWVLAGHPTLVVDTRGQGWGPRLGTTPDPWGGSPAAPGMLTRGIEDPETYYYRRAFTDVALAVDTVRVRPESDSEQVVVTGISQGGGLTIAAAALSDGVTVAMPDVPFLCDFPRATTLVDTLPYAELTRYLAGNRDAVERSYRTLSYFDGAVLAAKATAPALFSTALMDQTCPPSTVFAAYHAWGGPAEIEVYSHNGHEGGGAHHRARQLRWLADQLPTGV